MSPVAQQGFTYCLEWNCVLAVPSASVSEKASIKEKGDSVIVIDSDSDGEKDLSARRNHAHLQASVPQSVIQARPSHRPASIGRPTSVGLPTSGTRPGSAGRPLSSGGQGLSGKPPPLTVVPVSSNKPTRTTATVTPLSQSASTMTVTSGNSSSNNAMSTTRTSSFAAALRKLAKKATDIHDEPVSDTSPSSASRNSTPSHSSKSSHIIPTPHMIPTSTPPVVTIAPTQTANHGLDSKREHEHHHHHRRPASSERHHMRPPSESSHSSSSHAIHSSLWNSKDSSAGPHRWDEKPVAQLASTPDEVPRGFHPYRHAEELHKALPPTHMQYDPTGTSVFPAGYPYHPAFLPPSHMQLSHLRLDEHYDRYGYPGIRPHFLPISSHHGLPMHHPSMHHLLGVRHPMDLSLQSSHLQAASMGSHHLLAIDREKMLLEHREREKLAEEVRREEREKEREREERETERIRAAAAHERHRPRSRDEDRHYHSSKEPPPAHLKESHSNHHNHRVSHHNADMNVHMAHQHHRVKEEKWTPKPADYRKEMTDGHSVSPHYRNSYLTTHDSVSKNDHRTSDERSMREHLLRQERHVAKRHEREKSNSEHMRKAPLRVDIPTSKPPPLISPSKPNHEDILRQKFYDRRTVNHVHQVANQYEYDRLPPNNIEPSALSSKRVQSNHESLSRSPHMNNSEAERIVTPAEKPRNPLKLDRPSVATDYPYDYRKQRNSEFVPQPINNFTRSWMIPSDHNVISKLDLEEKKRQESRQIGIYFTSDSESDSEEDVEDKKERYRTKMEKISSKSCFPLDRSKAKMNLFQTVGLVTQRKKEALKSQKRMKRRQLLQEDCLCPAKKAKIEEPRPGLPSPLPITNADFEREPDYKSKCQFFSGLSLEVVLPERRKAMDKEQSIILAYRAKRKENEDKQKENEQNLKLEVSKKKMEPVAADATQTVQLNKLESEVDGRISTSSPHRASAASPVVSNPSPLLQIAPPRDHKTSHSVDSQYSQGLIHGKMPHEKAVGSIRHKSNNVVREIKKEPYDTEPRATLNYGTDLFRHSPSITSAKPKTLAENFVQEFHQSVLRTTQEALANQKSGQNSVVYHPRAESPKTKRRETVINLSTQQAPSSASSQQAEKHAQKEQEMDVCRSEEASFKWPGLEVLMEAYRRHINEHNMEKAILCEQISKLKAHNSELMKLAGQVQSKKQELLKRFQRIQNTAARICTVA
ncbi:genetic suppressor element 1-like [Anneissia japonica]|uniref:genetic suppressor element 1-like n=1 Tax=Anneissia japonica TaxID=1529436 RepID=UPI001425AA55|nr:genetic suppressor element 1-like [Anneissia japonica]